MTGRWWRDASNDRRNSASRFPAVTSSWPVKLSARDNGGRPVLPELFLEAIQLSGARAQRLERHTGERNLGGVVEVVHVLRIFVDEQQARGNAAGPDMLLEIGVNLGAVARIIVLGYLREI